MPAPVMLWRMEFNYMIAISDLHVIDKLWGQYKADLGIIKYFEIVQHFEDKCVLYLTFFFCFHGVFYLKHLNYFELSLF